MPVKHRQPLRTVRMVADDDRLVSHSGLLVVEAVAARLGLQKALTAEVGLPFRTQPPGRTLVRLAEMLIAGGDCVGHLAGLRDQPALWAEERVAHPATAWRLLAERLVGNEDQVAAELWGVARARRTVRERAWRAGMRPATVTIDIDAHLVTSHSDAKQAASATFKGGFGFAPMLAYLAETGEALAAILRPGCGSPMDAADQLEVVDLALAQLPDDVERGAVLVRADGAAYAKDVVDGLLQRGVCFLVGARLVGPVRDAVLSVPGGRLAADQRPRSNSSDAATPWSRTGSARRASSACRTCRSRPSGPTTPGCKSCCWPRTSSPGRTAWPAPPVHPGWSPGRCASASSPSPAGSPATPANSCCTCRDPGRGARP